MTFAVLEATVQKLYLRGPNNLPKIAHIRGAIMELTNYHRFIKEKYE